MSGQHAYLPPSGADAWVRCAQWPEMQRQYPETGDHDAAREGEAAHWAGAEMLAGSMVAEGQITPAGTVLDAEMIEGAEIWVDDVLRTVPGAQLHIEEHQPAGRIHPQNAGTPDTWALYQGVLYVWDYKHGHGIVEAWENWQLLNYAALILARLGDSSPATQLMEVVMTVVQPRAFHRDGPVRRWRVQVRDLLPYWQRLEMAAEDATSGHQKATPSEACTYCTGRHACEALQRDAYRSAQISMQAAPLGLATEAAGTELALLRAAAKRLDARVTGLEQQMETALKFGDRSSRWVLEQVPGREAWTIPTAQVRALGEACAVPLVKESPLTPRQARAAGIPDDLVASLTERKQSVKLAPFAGSTVARMFKPGGV